jgi:hypothetical protein
MSLTGFIMKVSIIFPPGKLLNHYTTPIGLEAR